MLTPAMSKKGNHKTSSHPITKIARGFASLVSPFRFIIA